MRDEEKTREQFLAENESLRAMFSESKKAVSECRWVEAAFRESEERYRRLLESITDYIYTVKVENGRPVSTTHGPGCLVVTGYTSEQYQMHPNLWYEMIYKEDRKAVCEQAEKLLKGVTVQPLEHRIIHKDSSIRWVRNTPVPHHDKDGNLVSYDGIIVDITERKQAEEALRESKEKFRTIAVSANDAIIMMDDEAKISYWNPAAERIFGYSKEEAIGKILHELIVSMGQHADFSKGFRRFWETGEGPVIGKTLELAGIRKDGTEFFAEHSISAVKVKGKWNAIGIVRDISERKKAEEALRASQEYSRNVIESSLDMIIAVDNDRKITEFNKAAQEAFGYPLEEVLGKHVDILYVESAEGLQVHKMALENGRYVQEVLNRRKNGELFPTLLSASVLQNAKGEVIGVMGISHDITRRKRDEEAIERAKKEWEATFDAITDPLFIHDSEFKLVRANSAYQVMAGMEFEEFIGRPYYEVFPKMDGPLRMCLKAKELREEEEVSCPVTKRIFKVRFYPIKDVNGGYLYSVHTLEDITEAKKAEEHLRESEERFRSLVNNIPDVVWSSNSKGETPYISPVVEKVYGYTPKEIAEGGESLWFSRVHSDDIGGLKESYGKLFEKSEKFDIEYRIQRKDGAWIWLHDRAIAIYEKDGVLYADGIFSDITERKRAEEKIRREMETTTHLLMIAEATAKTTDIDKLMEQVVHCVHRIMGCDICLSYLWEKGDKVFKPCREIGFSRGAATLFRVGVVGRDMEFVRKAMEGRRPVMEYVGAGLAPAQKGPPQGLPLHCLKGVDIGAIAVIPLLGRKEPLGMIIGIYSAPPPQLSPIKEEGGMRERDMKVMEGIMHEVSVAIEEARLYRDSIDRAMELSGRIETLKAMHEIDKAVLSTLNRDEILETAMMMVAKVVPCDRATIALVDKERGGFIYAAGFGIDFLPKGAVVSFGETSTTTVIETGRPEYVNNLTEIEDLLPLEKRLFGEGFLSHVRVPLTAKGEVIGVLSVGTKKSSIFTPENLTTIEKLASQVGVAMENSRLVLDLEELFLGTVRSLSSAIDAKSPWTAGHSERVTKYALDIGKEMGLSEKELKDLELAGLLHDVGKIGTYEYILDKPDRLTDDETKIMRQHPGKGANILMSIKQLMPIIPAIKHHHEFYDGTGYPDGLLGTAIPLFARILTVADTVDAMGADRPYRNGRAMDVIVAELKRCSGTQFDPRVMEAFLKVIGEKEEFKMTAT